MQVTLINNVNIRQTPGTEFAPIGYYPIGTSISVSKIVSGQSIEGNLSWYQLDNGNYIWAGGTDTAQGANNFNINPNQWHLLQYSIPQLWQEFGCKGEGVKIAVLDTGIINNYTDYFGDHIKLAKSFSGGANAFDKDGHGSHCAGIAGAIGAKDNVSGVAPGCDMYIGDIYNNGSTDYSYLANAINFFSSQPNKVDIISISQGFAKDQNDILLKAIETATINKDIIIVGAAGDYNPNEIITDILFPAVISPVLSVGAINIKNNTQGVTLPLDNIQVYAPGINIFSIGLPPKFSSTESGTSAATPFIAGLLALGIQLYKQKTNPSYKIANLSTILINSCDTFTDYDTSMEIKIVNPYKFLNQVKNNQ